LRFGAIASTVSGPMSRMLATAYSSPVAAWRTGASRCLRPEHGRSNDTPSGA